MSRRVLGIVGKSLVFLAPVIFVGIAMVFLLRAEQQQTKRQEENLRAAGRLEPDTDPRAPRVVGLTVDQMYKKLDPIGAQPDLMDPEGRRLPNVSGKWRICTQEPPPGKLIFESYDGTHHMQLRVAKRMRDCGDATAAAFGR